ncbi:MAG: (d)CMP kinase [Anaerolineales bacterium]
MTLISMIAIDGPAASGKSTLAQRLAAELDYLYFDTGVMYRAVTLAVVNQAISPDDEAAVTRVAHEISIDVRPPSKNDGRPYDVLLDAEDVTWEIRSPEVDNHVSQVSTYLGVRKAMTQRQREIGLRGQVVMVGRDIGTVVLPEADLKIYLDASIEERAKRRYLESKMLGEESTYEEVLRSMKARDRTDSTRELAPLLPARDAVVLDTTDLSVEQVLHRARKLIAEKSGSDPSEQAGSQASAVQTEARRMRVTRPGVSWWAKLFRLVARPVFRLLYRLLSRVEMEGMERIPTEGSYLVVSNHVSILEAPMVISFWPHSLEVAGAAAVLERPFQGRLMRAYGAMPIYRGTADRAVLDNIVANLRSGLPVFLNPEGGRSHVPGMQKAKAGAAYVVGKTSVPVVPVGVIGSEAVHKVLSLKRRPRLRMVVGDPIQLPPVPWRSPERKAVLEQNTERLMRAIAELLPPEYRGVYG